MEWPPAFLQAVRPTRLDEDQRKLLAEIQALESVQDQVAQPLFKAMEEQGMTRKVKAGSRGLNKVPHLSVYLQDQVKAKPSLDTVSPALSQDGVPPARYPHRQWPEPRRGGILGRSVTSSTGIQTPSGSPHSSTSGSLLSSFIG